MPDDTREQVLHLAGGGLAYRSFGEGPLVVLTHAFGPLAWGEVGRLAETCTVAIPDWEASTLKRDESVTLGWFEPLTRALGHRRGTLCAWSMSGPGAIWFAAEEPPALSGLILVDVAGLRPEMPPLRWRELRHFIALRLLGRPTRGFARMLWRNWVWRKGLDTRALEEATLRFFRANPDAYGMPGNEEEDEEEQDEPLIDELPSIEVPTLILTGRHSQVLGPEHAGMSAQRLPDGRVVVFENSGHALQLEEPERFQDVVSRFALDTEAPLLPD